MGLSQPVRRSTIPCGRGMARIALALALLLLSSISLVAQNSGVVRGHIVDEEANPLPGVTVTVRSVKNPSANNLGTVTDARGEFRIANLPPGNDYQLSASFPGLTTVIQRGIEVSSGRVTPLDFILVEEMVTMIRVEAVGGVVDTTTAMATTTINEEFIEGLPILGRNFTDLLVLAPGVTDTDGDGKPNVHGAREVDFQLRLDGVVVNDPFGGEETSQINIEAIDEIRIISTGANAEYGRFQGGMGQVTTKSGGNEFQGSFKFFYQTRSLDGDGAHNQDIVDIDIDSPSFRTVKPFLTLGGALRKDRIWYFLANQYIDQQEPINLAGITRNQGIEGWNEFGKLTWQINADHKVSLSVNYDPRTLNGNNLNIGTSPRSDYELKRTLPVVTAHETWVISPTMLLDSTVSLLDGRQRVSPVVELTDLTLNCPDLLNQPVLHDLTCARIPLETYTINFGTGQINGPWWFNQDQDSSRFTWKEDLSFFVDDFMGSHQFKVGFEGLAEDYRTAVTQRPLRYDFSSISRGTQVSMFADFENRLQEAEAEGTSIGIYVQDAWRILPNLTLNVGLRWEQENLEAAGQTVFDPAAERAEFNALADLVYDNFDPGPLEWDENRGTFDGCAPGTCDDPNFRSLPGERPCDIAGPDGGPPDGLCDFWDRIAISRIFTRHENERAPSGYFTPTPGEQQQFDLPGCGDPRRQGTCRGEEDIDLENRNLAPRISIAYDPFADGKTKFFASWGRFYDRLFLATIIPEQTRDFTYISFVKRERGSLPPTFDTPSQRNFQIYQVSRDLRTPFVDEFTVGFERELSPEFSIGVRYIRRKGRDQIQTRDINHFTRDQDGDGLPDDDFLNDDPLFPNTVQTPDSFPDLFTLNPMFGGIFFLSNINTSDYRALETHFTKRLSHNWQFDASYVYSEAVGNAEAFEDFFLGSDTSQVDLEFGHLGFDQRHVIKFNAVAHFPKGIQFGTRVMWESGLPFSLIRRGFTFDELGNPTFRQLFPTRQRNDQRNEGRWLIDLNLAKDFNIGAVKAGMEFMVTNLMNSDDLEIGAINDAFGSLQLVDGTRRRFGRRFQIGFRLHF